MTNQPPEKDFLAINRVVTNSRGSPEGFRRRGAVCIVAAPRRCLASTSSRRLASDPAALATRPTGVCQHPVNPPAGVWLGAEFVRTPTHRGLW